MDIVGERILVARRRQRLAQKDLAATIGMSQKHLSQVETGVKHGLHLRAEAVIRLAKALGVSADYLLGLTATEYDSQRHSRPTVPAPADAELSLEAGYRAMAAENRQLAEEALVTAAEVLS